MSQEHTYIFVPLEDRVVLPHMTLPVPLDESRKAAFRAARDGSHPVLLLPKIGGRYGRVGTIAQVEEIGRLPDGTEAAVVRGVSRATVTSAATEADGTLRIDANPMPDPKEFPGKVYDLAKEYRATIENLLDLRGARGVAQMLRGVDHPGQLADVSAYSPDLSLEQRLELLETVDVTSRLEKLLAWSKEALTEESLRDRIRSEVNEGLEKTQRDFYLRQQLETIKKQLGDNDGDVVGEYRQRIAEKELPDHVRKEVERELGRLQRTSEQNPEHGWIRNYLDWMLDLPWGNRSDDRFDIAEARRILDADHTGLADVKDRIIEFLAVKKRREGR
ncbi:MAG: LON peptidase substrate-binding domain-containing protein, partial [Chloroflexota bacterium]